MCILNVFDTDVVYYTPLYTSLTYLLYVYRSSLLLPSSAARTPSHCIPTAAEAPA